VKLTKSKLRQIVKKELSQLHESERYPDDDEPLDWLEDRRFEPSMSADPKDIQTIADDAWKRMSLVAEKAGVDVGAFKSAYQASISQIKRVIKASKDIPSRN